MATIRRTVNPQISGYQSTVRRASPIAHSTPQIQSSMRGIDPRSADMTAAIQNFFGQVINERQKDLASQHKVKLQREEEINRLATVEAQANANFDLTATSPRSTPPSVSYEGEDVDVSNRRSYVNTYEEVSGMLQGTDAFSQMNAASIKENIPPSQMNIFGKKWLEDNWGKGTGQDYYDMGFMKSWNSQWLDWSHNNQKNTADLIVKQTKDTVNVGIAQDFTETGVDNYETHVAQFIELNPGLLRGEAQSAVLGLYLDSATTADDYSRIEAFIFKGKDNESFNDRFPQRAKKLLDKIDVNRKSFTTENGSDAVKSFNKELTSVKTRLAPGIGESPVTDYLPVGDKPSPLFQELTALQEQITELENTPGVSQAQIAKAKSDLTKAEVDYATKAYSIQLLAEANWNDFNKLDDDEQEVTWDRFVENATENPDALVEVSRLLVSYNDGGHSQKYYLPESYQTHISTLLKSGEKEKIMAAASIIASLETNGLDYSEEFMKDDIFARTIHGLSKGGNWQLINQLLSEDSQKTLQIYADDDKQKTLVESFDTTDGSNVSERVAGGYENLNKKVLEAFGFDDNDILDSVIKEDIRKAIPWAATIIETSKVGVVTAENIAKAIKANNLLPRKLIQWDQDDRVQYGDSNINAGVLEASGRAIYNVPLTNNYHTSWGKTVNVVKNLEHAAKTLDAGLPGAKISGETITDIHFGRPQIDASTNQTIMPLFAETDEQVMAPMVIEIGEEFVLEPHRDKKGEAYSFWHSLAFWSEGFKNIDVKLTGNAEEDMATMARIHPAITLIPENINGKLVGYRLAMRPYVELPDNIYSDGNLQELSGLQGDELRKALQARHARLKETLRIASEITTTGILGNVTTDPELQKAHEGEDLMAPQREKARKQNE